MSKEERIQRIRAEVARRKLLKAFEAARTDRNKAPTAKALHEAIRREFSL